MGELPILQNSSMLQIHLCFQLTIMGGRIALKGWANYNSPLHVCYPNVGKYHVNTCKYVCKHTKKHHGLGMRAFACVVGAKSASWRSGVCDEIRPHRNLPILQIYPMLQNSSMLQIHPCCKFVHITIHPHHNLPTSLP